MVKRRLSKKEYAGLYEVTEDGQIYSIRKEKYLTPQKNGVGYSMYFLTPHKAMVDKGEARGKWEMAHRLVALEFLPPAVEGETDCRHKDGDRGNNHWRNLEWLTHSESIKRSFRENGVPTGIGRPRGKHVPRAIVSLSDAKKRRVWAESEEWGRKEFMSVQALLDALGVDRRAFNRALRSGGRYRGMEFGYLGDDTVAAADYSLNEGIGL